MPYDRVSFDVVPGFHTVIKANYFAVEIVGEKPIAVVGNPPFRLAVPIFNHAARQADVIAMILPLTFRRDSVLRQLDDNFHLLAETDVPEWAFLRAGKPYNVPATLQIWERRSVKRVKPVKHASHPHFTIDPVKPTEHSSHPDLTIGSGEDFRFLIQRIGVDAGRIHREFHRENNAHLCITADPSMGSLVEAIFNSIDFMSVARNTSANPFLTKADIYSLYIEMERLIFGYSHASCSIGSGDAAPLNSAAS